MKYLSWKLKKLPAMGPREILFRLGRKLAENRERIAYHAGWFDWHEEDWRRRLCHGTAKSTIGNDLPAWWIQHMRQRAEPPFLLNAAMQDEAAHLYPQLFGEQREELIAAADRVCRRKFAFLGIDFQAADPIPWQCDPQSEREWPKLFYADVEIPFCDGTGSKGAPGDVKHVWELNRHEFLIDCAKAFYLTGENRFAECVLLTIRSWIRGNPYLQGVNWAGPLEVAVRAMSWLWAYQFCRRWDGISAQDHLEIIKAFYRHGVYLHRHMEVYSSPNNHLVGEATALYLLGCFFPEFDKSTGWRKRGWEVISQEADQQFYNDGGSTEQATSYHHYCLGFFLLAVLTRQCRGELVPKTILQRLQSALEFSMWLTTPDGTVPKIGDCDDARSIRFGPIRLWDFRNLLCLGAILFRRSDMKAIAGSFSEDALWLLGRAGYEGYQRVPTQTPMETARVFKTSGYAILRSGWDTNDHYLCFDCGPIGGGVRSDNVPEHTHGHADMLSFTLYAFGKPLLVDSGFYTFNGQPDWHSYCRDVSGHNTVRVDGASQAKMTVCNHWSCVTEPRKLAYYYQGDTEWVEGSHGGFHGLQSSVTHHRSIAWVRKKYWIIFDRLEGEGEHFVEIFFHFASGHAKVLPDADGVIVETEEDLKAQLTLLGSDQLCLELHTGGTKPDQGWIATSYGCRKPAPFVRFHGRIHLPVSLTFVLIPYSINIEDLTAKQMPWFDEGVQFARIGSGERICRGTLAETLVFLLDCQKYVEKLPAKGSL
jgi:hypothetical protein